jgi:hypothetical protein
VTLLQEKQMVPVPEDGADGARYGLIADEKLLGDFTAAKCHDRL